MMIFVCMPHTEIVRARTIWSLMELALYSYGKNISISLNHLQGSMITTGKNRLVQYARENKADYILLVDSDMMFPKDGLVRLLAHEKDIVGCIYRRRFPPFGCVGTVLNDPGNADFSEALRLPGGFILINMKVFDKLPWPWFHERYNPEERVTVSEDYAFSDLARDHGYKLYCDLKLSKEIAHIGELYVTLDDPPQAETGKDLRSLQSEGKRSPAI